MNRAIEFLVMRLGNAEASKIDSQKELARAHENVTVIEGQIEKGDATIADIEAALTALSVTVVRTKGGITWQARH